MNEMSQFDPQLGYMPAISEPFWLKKWWWLKHRPHCYPCMKTFKTRTEWNLHYVLVHIEPAETP